MGDQNKCPNQRFGEKGTPCLIVIKETEQVNSNYKVRMKGLFNTTKVVLS
jgi:hypothetical protein